MIDNMSRKDYRRRRPRIDTLKRGVYILPNFLTSMGLFCGFFSIISTLQGDYLRAAWAIVIAGVFDGLDGRIARMTNTTSKFGVEYDSLADLVAFGVAPALLSYAWVLDQYGRLGWLAAFLYVACGAVRLARFNVMTDIVKSSHFQGLPIPGAAGMVSTTVIFCFHFNFVDKVPLSMIFVLLIFFLAFLMVSSIKFSSFKGLDLKAKLFGRPQAPMVVDFVAGLGGREINARTIHRLAARAEESHRSGLVLPESEWVDLDRTIVS